MNRSGRAQAAIEAWDALPIDTQREVAALLDAARRSTRSKQKREAFSAAESALFPPPSIADIASPDLMPGLRRGLTFAQLEDGSAVTLPGGAGR